MSETLPRNIAELTDGPRAFTVAETARRLTVTSDVVYELLASGELRSVSIGRRRIIPSTELARFLDEGEK